MTSEPVIDQPITPEVPPAAPDPSNTPIEQLVEPVDAGDDTATKLHDLVVDEPDEPAA